MAVFRKWRYLENGGIQKLHKKGGCIGLLGGSLTEAGIGVLGGGRLYLIEQTV